MRGRAPSFVLLFCGLLCLAACPRSCRLDDVRFEGCPVPHLPLFVRPHAHLPQTYHTHIRSATKRWNRVHPHLWAVYGRISLYQRPRGTGAWPTVIEVRRPPKPLRTTGACRFPSLGGARYGFAASWAWYDPAQSAIFVCVSKIHYARRLLHSPAWPGLERMGGVEGILTHEMGHGLGLPHLTWLGGLMAEKPRVIAIAPHTRALVLKRILPLCRKERKVARYVPR